MGGLGGGSLAVAQAWHAPTTPHATTPARRANHLDHPPHRTTSRTTSGPHNEHSYHTPHHGHRHAGDWHDEHAGLRLNNQEQTACRSHSPAAQRIAHQPRAVWIGMTAGTKPHARIAPISSRKARRLDGRVGRLASVARSRAACANHTPTQPHPAPRALIGTTRRTGSHAAPRALIGTTRRTESRSAPRADRTTSARTTPCTTGRPHHGQSDHTLHHGQRHDGDGHNGHSGSRPCQNQHKACRPRSPAAQRPAR